MASLVLPAYHEFDLDDLLLSDSLVAISAVFDAVESASSQTLTKVAKDEAGIFAILEVLMCSPLVVWIDINETSIFLKNQMPWHIQGGTLNLSPLWNYLQKLPGIPEDAVLAYLDELSQHELPWRLRMPWDSEERVQEPMEHGCFGSPRIDEPGESEMESLFFDDSPFQDTMQDLDAVFDASWGMPQIEDPVSNHVCDVSIIVGVVASSPLAMWVNIESFQRLLDRRLPEYIKAGILDLEPIWDNLSRIPGVSTEILEHVCIELSRQELPWKLCLPHSLECFAELHSQSVVSRRTFASLNVSHEALSVVAPHAHQFESDTASTEASPCITAPGPHKLGATAVFPQVGHESIDILDEMELFDDVEEDESVSLHAFLDELPDDVLQQLELLLQDQPNVGGLVATRPTHETPRHPLAEERSFTKVKAADVSLKSKPRKSRRPRSEVSTKKFKAPWTWGFLTGLGLREFTRRSGLLLLLFCLLCLTFWLKAVTARTFQNSTTQQTQRSLLFRKVFRTIKVSPTVEPASRPKKKSQPSEKELESSED